MASEAFRRRLIGLLRAGRSAAGRSRINFVDTTNVRIAANVRSAGAGRASSARQSVRMRQDGTADDVREKALSKSKETPRS